MNEDSRTAERLADHVHAARLQDLNGLGIEGNAFLAASDDALATTLTVNGLDPDMTHIQHIHGVVDETGQPLESRSPTLADDLDGDGIVELAEGATVYGPILTPLSSPPGGALPDFPTAAGGRVEFAQTYDLNDPSTFNGDFTRDQLLPLDLREVVVHGGTLAEGAGAGTDGEADGTPGFKLVLPVATGEIDQAVKVYTAEIGALNDSGVTGKATLLLDGQQLTVKVEAQGVEPGMIHAQHIHGAFDADGQPIDSTTPVPAQDTDGDGFIELAEGATSYGPVLISLTDPIGAGLPGFPTAPNGEIDYQTVIDLGDPSVVADGFVAGDLLPLSLREIIIHGLTVDGTAGEGTTGEVDGTAGFKLLLPVAAGELEFQGVIAADENVLPALAEKVAVQADEIVAVEASRLSLSADAGAPDATITFNDEHAGFDNTLGVFLIGSDGSLGPVRSVFASTEHAEGLPGPGGARPGGGERVAGESVSLSDLFAPEDLTPGGDVGLFLLKDGASSNDAAVLNGTSLAFVDSSTGEAASLATSTDHLQLIDTATGSELVGEVVHALAGLNADGSVLAIGGTDPVSGVLDIAFEDSTDMDFNDLEIAFDNGTGGDHVLGAGEIEALVASAEPAVA